MNQYECTCSCGCSNLTDDYVCPTCKIGMCKVGMKKSEWLFIRPNWWNLNATWYPQRKVQIKDRQTCAGRHSTDWNGCIKTKRSNLWLSNSRFEIRLVHFLDYASVKVWHDQPLAVRSRFFLLIRLFVNVFLESFIELLIRPSFMAIRTDCIIFWRTIFLFQIKNFIVTSYQTDQFHSSFLGIFLFLHQVLKSRLICCYLLSKRQEFIFSSRSFSILLINTSIQIFSWKSLRSYSKLTKDPRMLNWRNFMHILKRCPSKKFWQVFILLGIDGPQKTLVFLKSEERV